MIPPSRRAIHLRMPTLAACSAACLALLVAVGLQQPAVSVGLRWKPGPRSPGLEFIPLDPTDMPAFDFNGTGRDSWPSWITWTLLVLAVLTILITVFRWYLAIRRTPATRAARIGADVSGPIEVDARILQSGLAAAIELLDSDRPPGNAVVQAWQGLEDAAAAAGLTRHPAETASEYTARILYRSRRSADPIAVLLSLYQRVRFGEHEPTAGEIAIARNALALLVELWQADLPERRTLRAGR